MHYKADQANPRLIVLSGELPHEGSGMLLHYEHEPVTAEGWTTCDARDIVRIHEDVWLSEIESWHRELSDQASRITRWWWLLPGSRLILWETITSFSLKPILFALAVIDLCARQPTGTIWIMGAPVEVAEYLSEWAAQEKIVQVSDKRASTAINPHDHRFFNTIKLWVKSAKQVVFFLIHVAFRKKKRIGSASVIANSLVLNPDLIQTIGDHFFGHMLDDINGLTNDSVIWLYSDLVVNPSTAKVKLAEIGRCAYFSSDLFRWSDVWFALRTGFTVNRILKKYLINLPALRAGGVLTSSFPRYFISNLVIQNIPFFELVLYKQFNRMITESGASVVIYPYEEKPMERALLIAARENSHQVKTIGFAHATYSKGHLYIRRGLQGEPPRPDVIAVAGRISRDNFESVGVPHEQIVITGSPRYCNPASDVPSRLPKSRMQILFICGLGFEMRILAALLENKPGLLDKHDLIIRRSHHSWINEQDAAEVRMQAAGIAYRCESGDLMTQIDNSDVVIFESTSAAIQAILRGKLAIRLNLSDIISTNHFFGSGDHNEIQYCRNADELKEQLDHIASLTPNQYAMAVQRQREVVEGLYSPIDQVAVDNLFGFCKRG